MLPSVAPKHPAPRRRTRGFTLLEILGAALDAYRLDNGRYPTSLLAVPSITAVPMLRIDPAWNPLRDYPRFQALLAKYEN